MSQKGKNPCNFERWGCVLGIPQKAIGFIIRYSRIRFLVKRLTRPLHRKKEPLSSQLDVLAEQRRPTTGGFHVSGKQSIQEHHLIVRNLGFPVPR